MKKAIVALGADMKNRFLFAEGKNLRFGPDLGDLGDAENFEKFKKEIKKAVKKTSLRFVIRDLHPGYFSTRLAEEKIKAHSLMSVQHHHAHIASVIAEHGLKKPVIGVSFDGTGYGTDGNIWGGEFLMVTGKGFVRQAHLAYQKMPGGDKVIKEPWRMVLSIMGKKAAGFLKNVGEEEKEIVLRMIEKNINCPLTSSAGRIFDAASALTGVCTHASYEAEGPIKLERLCDKNEAGRYKFKIKKSKGTYEIDVRPVFAGMLCDIKRKKKKNIIAARFHNSMAGIIIDTVKKLSRKTGIKTIALSGGVFQNNFLKEKISKALRGSKFRIFTNEKTPVNDLNISLGQYHVLSCSGKD